VSKRVSSGSASAELGVALGIRIRDRMEERQGAQPKAVLGGRAVSLGQDGLTAVLCYGAAGFCCQSMF